VENLKLFVWEEVLKDWYYGTIVVYASSVQAARELVRAKLDKYDLAICQNVFDKEPIIYTDAVVLPFEGGA